MLFRILGWVLVFTLSTAYADDIATKFRYKKCVGGMGRLTLDPHGKERIESAWPQIAAILVQEPFIMDSPINNPRTGFDIRSADNILPEESYERLLDICRFEPDCRFVSDALYGVIAAEIHFFPTGVRNIEVKERAFRLALSLGHATPVRPEIAQNPLERMLMSGFPDQQERAIEPLLSLQEDFNVDLWRKAHTLSVDPQIRDRIYNIIAERAPEHVPPPPHKDDVDLFVDWCKTILGKGLKRLAGLRQGT